MGGGVGSEMKGRCQFFGDSYRTIEVLIYHLISYYFKQKIMTTSKKKADLSTILDDLRHEDSKKRFAAVHDIKQVAVALGPARVRTELISFLAQFLDDDETIVLELLTQLDSFTNLMGGLEQEKQLLPLLISFCKTDEKKVATKSVKPSKDLALDTIKKLLKADMNVTRECTLQLISNLFPILESCDNSLMELYSPMFSSENPQTRIIATKFLSNFQKNVKNKDDLTKIFEKVYSQGGELEKIFALEALSDFYESSNNFVLTKFKHLAVINSWRVNIKICQLAPKLGERLNKAHFKLIFEPVFLKFMSSTEPELRCSSCLTFVSICKNMSEEEQKSKLMPVLKKLSQDQYEYVRVELSKNIVELSKYISSELMTECIVPIIISFMRDANSEVALGIAKHFDLLASKMNKEALDERIVKPLLQQLTTDNWRVKCEIISILKGFLANQAYLNDKVIRMFISLTEDRIDAVRLKANQFIIEVVNKNSKEWCEQNVICKVFSSIENMSYIKKQNLLDIIDKTAPNVSEKAFKETYQSTLVSYMTDKVSNVRVKSMQVLKKNNKLLNTAIERNVDKLKEDKDHEVRDLAKKLRA